MTQQATSQPATRQDNLTRAEAQARARLISHTQYQVRLDVTGCAADAGAGEPAGTFGCEATIRFRCAEPGASVFVDLEAPAAPAITLNGRPLPPEAFDGHRIHLSDLQETNDLRVTATCEYRRTGMGLHHFQDPVDGRVYLYTQFEPFNAHSVYPCFDQPDIKATFDFSVLAPAGFEVVSNSAPAARPPEGEAGEWTFAPTPRLPTYVTAIVAGPYHAVRDRHGQVDLGLYCRQSLAQYLDPDELFEITKQGFDCFAAAFDYPYPFGKYDQVFVPEFRYGAMENAGCVTFADSYVFRSKVTEARREARAETILHELAHMWFGDLVTMRWWDDLWLNESFATFMGIYALARATRFANAWTTFATGTKAWAYRQDQLPTTHPITADIPDVVSVELHFDGITYAKGAAVLRQLVAWVGEDAFLQGVRTYFRRHEYGNAALRDFLAALEESSGRDLAAWSAEWLQTAGLNILRPAFDTADGRFTSFAVVQEAPPDWPSLRSHRVAVGLFDATDDGLARRRSVELDATGERTPVPDLAGEPVPALVLVNDGDLAYAKTRLDGHSLAALRTRLGGLGEPLARALCWSATWEAVRDAEMGATDYLPLVLNNIHGETDIGVVQSLLGRARSAILVYGAPERQEQALATLASASLAALRQAEPGSDRQLVWARTFAGAARSSEHLGIVRGLLDGTQTFEGLAVDTDLRWHLVRSLAAAGAAGPELIDQELARDATDQGKRQAAAAHASRPAPEAKAQAWEAITRDTALPLATLRALMDGFQQPQQDELLQPYVTQYFDALEGIWRDRSLEVSLAFAEHLYPRTIVDEAVVGLTDEYLGSRSPAPPIRRLLLEGRDDLRRALKARARDAQTPPPE